MWKTETQRAGQKKEQVNGQRRVVSLEPLLIQTSFIFFKSGEQNSFVFQNTL